MRFFLDNNLPPRLAAGLRELCDGEQDVSTVVHLKSKFPPDAEDPDWLRALGREGDWIVISADDRIRVNKANKEAWHESGLTVIFLAPPFTNLKYWKLVAQLIEWFPAIKACGTKAPTGHGFLFQPKAKEPTQIYPEVRKPSRR